MTAVKGLVLAGGFLALAAFQTWPVLARFGSRLGSQGSDMLLQTWTLAWDVHALTTDPRRFFDANIMYPLERTLALSDHLLGVLPLFGPVYLLTGNVIAGFNTVVLLSGPIAALGAAALGWWWTRRWWPAAVAGALFGFAPLRVSQAYHLQLLAFIWAPWALVFLDRFLRVRRWRDLWAFALFYWLQVLSSFYLGMMLTVGVTAYVGYYALGVDRGFLGRAMAARAAAFVAASLVVLLPTHWPYVEVQRAWQAGWTLGAMVGYSADLQSYLSAPALVNDLYVSIFRPVTPAGAHERLLFPGLVLPALALLGAFARIRGVADLEVRRARRLFGLLAAVAFVLSLGPYLVIWGVNTRIPMPYQLLYYVVPGWSAMRVPARFTFLLLLAMVPLSALGAQVVAERAAALGRGATWPRLAPAAVGLGLIGLFVLELGAKPWPTQAMPGGRDVPEVYRWLARERPGPIVELPVALPQYEHGYLYFSTVHWQPLVNGRSSFAPWGHDAAKAVLAELPGPRGFEYAAALGLRAVVVHGDLLSAEERRRWTLAERAGRARRLAGFGGDAVYAVDPVEPAPTPGLRVDAPETLPAGMDVRLGLRLDNAEPRPWARPRPLRVDHATVRWTGPGAGPTRATTATVALPLVVAAGESAAIPLRLTTPTTPGRYTVQVDLAGQGLATERRTIEIRASGKLPTSADGADRLAARYLLEGTAARALGPAESARVKLVVLNTGGAVWLSRPRGKKGDVSLGWRWLDAGGRPTTQGSGLAAIRHDVYPGQSYAFDEWLVAPSEAGGYVVELGLVNGGVGAFAVEPPVRLVVDVREAARP